jgi:tetratricopeptide (TPR) repeat protein
MGSSYQYIGDIEKFAELQQRALDIRQSRLPYDAAAIAETLRSLSDAARLSGNLELAEQQLREAISLFTETHGANHDSVAYAIARLGEVLRMDGRSIEAVETLESAVAIIEGLGETEGENAIDIYGLLAIALDDIGRLNEAEIVNQKVVSASRLLLGDKDPNTLTRIGNLGLIQMRQGNYEAAQANIAEAYKGINEVWLSDSTSTAWAANIKGSITFYLGWFDESLAAYEENKRKTASVYGMNTLRYAKALQRIGEWHDAMGHHDDAIDLFKQALAVTAALGEDSSSRADSIRLDLTMAHVEAGDYEVAEGMARQALAAADLLRRRTMINLQRELARSLSLQGRYEEAMPLFDESLSGREVVSSNISISLLPTLVAISKHHRRSGEPEQALPVARRAHEIGLTIAPPGTWQSAFASAEYAMALQKSADSELAQALFDKAIAELVVAFGIDDVRIAVLRKDFETTVR